jgi:hypothetical protein
MGGYRDRDNYSYLTAREHFICHLLLTKMFSGKFKIKMCFALASMHRIKERNKKIVLTSWHYKKMKEANSYAKRNSPASWPIGSTHTSETKRLCAEAGKKHGFKKGYIPYNKDKKMPKELCEVQSKNSAARVKNGTHNMLSEEFKKKAEEAQEKMFGKGIHPFQHVSGPKNVNYDATVYIFKNKKTAEIVSMTRNQFIHQYAAPSQNVYQLIKGKRKSVIGWTLVTI